MPAKKPSTTKKPAAKPKTSRKVAVDTSSTVEAAAPLSLQSIEDIVRELPEELAAFLVRCAPTREFWKWLEQDERRKLMDTATRGFQRTAQALRQPMVRSRLAHHLHDNPDEFLEVLSLWGDQAKAPSVLTDIQALADQGEEALIAQLPELWRRHGGEALLLALLHSRQLAALEALDKLIEEGLDEAYESTTEQTTDEAAIEPPAPSGPTPEELAAVQAIARTWQEKAAKAEAGLAELRTQQKKEKQQQQLALEQQKRRLATLEGELQETKKTTGS